jgi:hypothetical protein
MDECMPFMTMKAAAAEINAQQEDHTQQYTRSLAFPYTTALPV